MKQVRSLRWKLIASFLSLGLIPLATSNLISFFDAQKEIRALTKEKGRILVEQKDDALTDYFDNTLLAMLDLAGTPIATSAIKEFSKPFVTSGSDQGFIAPDQNSEAFKGIKSFYTSTFGAAYTEKNKGQSAPIDLIVGKLDRMTVAAQFDYIVRNPNPLGQKHKMDRPDRSNSYAEFHARTHPILRKFLESHAFYDLFLVNNEGRVVYTVFKETDFATSLTRGPWANSGLARAFAAGSRLAPGESYIEDYANYLPSYEAPASFAAVPIFEDGKRIGVLITQLPLDKVTAVASQREGLGQKGETLLFGSDLKLRADTFRNKDTHNVSASFAKDSNLNFNSKTLELVSSGKSGAMESVAYDGVKVYSVFKPIKIKNLTWYLIVEFPKKEVYAGLSSLRNQLILILLLAGALTGFAGFTFASSISRRLNSIVDDLENSNREVSQASSQSAASATELSEAATEQAASLQETMASVEEISAMVTQNAESAKRVQEAVEVNQVATQEGSQSVSEMLQSIQEIKLTTDEILGQMESSNKEFGEIVRIIKTIDEKTKVINDIVFQTKLLSFNASVEAARAGEHGKGFAVVAEEVGNLAQMSGNAAKEITSMLSASILKVNEIVEKTSSKIDQLVEVGKDKIASGQSRAMACRAALDKVAQNASQVRSLVTEISHASKEQSQGVQEISKAISQLDQVTQQNSAVAQQSSAQAEQLHAQSQLLSTAVEHLVAFVTGDNEHELTANRGQPVVAPSVVRSIGQRTPASDKTAPKSVAAPLKKAAGDNGHAKPPRYEEF